ncbi:MAG TPA: hypothetical protein VK327_04065 [Candidatus Paceibacterota bacterium]|nr:hypothetical protein [Candidatus Paceibacterota bacterium]
MSRGLTIGVLSDVHYASAAEQARGDDYEIAAVANPLPRLLLRCYRHFIWLRHPLRQNHLLDRFLEHAGTMDFVIANGDYSCDSGFVGVSDDAAFQSANECLGKLRARFGSAFCATFGDHELGKFGFVGMRGGMRVQSLHRARTGLGLDPFWKRELNDYALIGVTSSLLALPALESEILPEELLEWRQIRAAHVEEIRRCFGGLKPGQRVLLFCHDPTALPFLAAESEVRARLPQIEATIVGHLHSPLIFWKSRILAGMPEIKFLGHSIRKMSRALHRARDWRPFNVNLCPSLAGVELLKDGGFLTLTLPDDRSRTVAINRHRIPR